MGGWIYYTAFNANGKPGAYSAPMGSIAPYVKSTQVYICPSDSQGRDSGNSYAMNNCLVQRTSTGFNPGRSLAAFSNSSSWMLLGEEASWFGDEEAINTQVDSTDDGYFNVDYGNVLSTRHLEGSLIAFLDGHSKAARPAQVASAGWQNGGAARYGCPP